MVFSESKDALRASRPLATSCRAFAKERPFLFDFFFALLSISLSSLSLFL